MVVDNRHSLPWPLCNIRNLYSNLAFCESVVGIRDISLVYCSSVVTVGEKDEAVGRAGVESRQGLL